MVSHDDIHWAVAMGYITSMEDKSLVLLLDKYVNTCTCTAVCLFLSLSFSLSIFLFYCLYYFQVHNVHCILFIFYLLLLFIRPVPAGKFYSIDPLLARFGGLVLSTLAAVCSSDSER